MNPALLQKQPWLISPEAFAPLFEATRTFFNSQDQPDPPVNSPLLQIEDGLGIVAISGPMLRKPDVFDRVFLGACDTEEVAAAIEEARSREDIQAIFLDIDSPGGSVTGTPELAHTVARASKEKYVYAFSSGQMCSAAYWVASQADAIYATPSARIGSIGVILPVLDSSAAFEKAGLKIEVFAAGKFKATGTPGTSLTDDQREWLQGEVEETFSEFRSAVLSRGRKIPDEAMEGQTFSARKAQRLNLAGVVESRAEAIARLRKLHVRTVDMDHGAMSAPSIETELAEARDQIARLQADVQAREALLEQTKTELTAMGEKVSAVETERQIDAEAFAQLRTDLDASRKEVETLKGEEVSLRDKLKELEARNASLESTEQDLEKRAALRAAQIVAETGTSAPAAITPKGDADSAANLYEQFRSIENPTEQTAFWQKLTPAQQAQILARAQTASSTSNA